MRQSTKQRPTAIDLFAGAGGLALGFEQAGFDILAAVEYDPVHAAVHEFNFPHTQVLCADVSQLSAEQLRKAACAGAEKHRRTLNGEVDVIFGGPPCQGFSTIGKRLIDDSRNNLVFHFFRIVVELKPRYFVMENVPGMKLGGHASILSRLIAEFQEAEYDIVLPPQVLNAADYGVPQERRRLFLLGAKRGQRLPHYPGTKVIPVAKRARKLERSARQGELPISSTLPLGPTVWDAIGDLPNLDDIAALASADEVNLSVTQLARMRTKASDYALRMQMPHNDRDDFSYPRESVPSLLTSSMRTEHTPLSVSRFETTAPGETEPVSRFYRLPKFGLCNTLRAGTGSERGAHTSPRPIHPSYPRVISVREAARLHSFPDWFRLHQTKWHGFRQVGNAVPPLLGRAVACEVRLALGAAASKPEEVLQLGDKTLLTMSMSEATGHFGAQEDSIPKRRTRTSVEGAA
jgi:DNA (cytosine-5)-methyltransferase 1